MESLTKPVDDSAADNRPQVELGVYKMLPLFIYLRAL
jgi:hypothetical protein